MVTDRPAVSLAARAASPFHGDVPEQLVSRLMPFVNNLEEGASPQEPPSPGPFPTTDPDFSSFACALCCFCCFCSLTLLTPLLLVTFSPSFGLTSTFCLTGFVSTFTSTHSHSFETPDGFQLHLLDLQCATTFLSSLSRWSWGSFAPTTSRMPFVPLCPSDSTLISHDRLFDIQLSF
ncbi:hypothetical protein LIA77_06616 [Sarocladium implicatum]|nr:hypothetical protein LIA77_06616 [Sarocladium implicatum]